jgi:hypothetical protein
MYDLFICDLETTSFFMYWVTVPIQSDVYNNFFKYNIVITIIMPFLTNKKLIGLKAELFNYKLQNGSTR